jgi:hypothetical protein
VERRDRFAQGVASGDPAPDSVLLWTRASAAGSAAAVALTVEVAEDPAFERVVATAPVRASPPPTTPAACWSAGCGRRAPTGIASPTRAETAAASAHAHAPGRRRSATGALRLRQLPERLRGRSERLPPE